ncbi:zinc-dependent alcohol dehydrogenase family protein [Flexistipes sp.]|uniref:zinc-dependent alcohol dehydrogenase family protein n=1 Tax=Flexistipes sp. TaxID=3088135 RepID=UPI002E1ABEA6|nr:zinc-dependent alcohol dehydrogenase family protein [Flexistipes sp.]
MKAMVLERITDLKQESKPLVLRDRPVPEIQNSEVLIKVKACGVCHTELDEIEGRTPPPRLPVVPGHEIVGEVVGISDGATKFKEGDRVGVGWIYSACGDCYFCDNGLENLCSDFKATGRDADGGYGEYMKVSEHFAVKIPDVYEDSQAAPLLCAGAVGYRSLKLARMENGQNLGFMGFGASAHLVLQLAKYLYPESRFFVFARSESQREFAKKLGAFWTGDIEDSPPEKCLSIIDTTPVYKTVLAGLFNISPSGRLVVNAISKEEFDKDILMNLDYKNHLWMEKELKSVANVTPADLQDFIKIAAKAGIFPTVEEYPLEEANKALIGIKNGSSVGAKVLRLA